MCIISFYVEDEYGQKGLFDIEIGLNWPVSRLKDAVQDKYQFPAEVQRWIICNKLASDDATPLKKLGVVDEMEPIFVYLVHPIHTPANVSKKCEDVISQDDKSKSAEWKCSVCTFTNSIEMKYCVTCFSLNPNDNDNGYDENGIDHQTDNHRVEEEEVFDPLKFWKCNQCTFINSIEMKNCVVCFSLNPNDNDNGYDNDENGIDHQTDNHRVEEEEVFDPLKFWKCNQCTFTNSIEMKNCVVCFSINPIHEGEGRALNSAKWQCPFCTFINDDEMKNCVICFTSNPDNKDYDDHKQEETVDPLHFWTCNKCTSVNSTEMKNCVTCFTMNPVFESNQYSANNYMDLVELDDEGLVLNRLPFECLICISEIEPQKGAILRDCLHKFCIDCLSELIKTCTEPEVKCPYQDNDYACNSVLQGREIKSLVSAEEYDSFLKKSLNIAEAVVPNSFHCKTTDCVGWCICEDEINTFECPICKQLNCLQCQAIHVGFDCKQYQDYLVEHSSTDANAKKSYEVLQNLLEHAGAMRCPNCKIICVKNGGCDHMKCSMCRNDFTWAPNA